MIKKDSILYTKIVNYRAAYCGGSLSINYLMDMNDDGNVWIYTKDKDKDVDDDDYIVTYEESFHLGNIFESKSKTPDVPNVSIELELLETQLSRLFERFDLYKLNGGLMFSYDVRDSNLDAQIYYNGCDIIKKIRNINA